MENQYEPDQQPCPRRRLLEPTANGVATQSKPTQWELCRTAKWHDPLEEVREEDDLLTGQELKLFQSVAARFNFLAMDMPDFWYSVKELMRKVASPRTQDITALERVARHTIKYSVNDLQISMNPIG